MATKENCESLGGESCTAKLDSIPLREPTLTLTGQCCPPAVDRDMWLEVHGYTLPASFPVVRAQRGKDEWCTTSATVPLCCCLTSKLPLVTERTRNEAALAKQTANYTSTIQEVVAVLKNLRVMAPDTGELTLLLGSFETREADPLLEALHVCSKTGRSTDTIMSNVGFMSASQLMPKTDSGSTKKKPKVTLTLGKPRTHAPIALSLTAIKASTQLPSPPPTVTSNNISIFDSMSRSAASSLSAGYDDASSKPPSDLRRESEEGETKQPVKRKATSITPATSKVSSSTPTTEKASAPAPPTKKARTSTSSSKADSVKSKESAEDRARRKAREKSSTSSSSSRKSVRAPWAADFASAFSAVVSSEVIESAAAFRRTILKDDEAAAAADKKSKHTSKEAATTSTKVNDTGRSVKATKKTAQRYL